jgi:hypothetical protein
VETIKNFVTFCKGIDPTGINNVTLVGLNTPCRIGRACACRVTSSMEPRAA